MKRRFITTSAYFVLAFILFSLGVFYAVPKINGEAAETKATPCAVRLWNIDTFEGGKGSRTAFLNGVSTAFERSENAFVLVSSYTAEGALAAFSEGNYPDMLSFGIGFCPPVEKLLSLREYGFFAGQSGEKTLAVPWCRGGYAVYSKTEDLSAMDTKNTVLSSGANNLTGFAAAMHGLSGEFIQKDPTTAYVEFLNGKYDYLIGTQRDACRFVSRNAEVYIQPIEEYCDLYQYISVLARGEEEQKVCRKFIELLLSEKRQKTLSNIGMLSAFYDLYGAEDPYHNALEEAKIACAPSAFLGEGMLVTMKEAARQSLLSGNAEVLKKFVKQA